MGLKIWSFDVLILRCPECKGLVESSPDMTIEQTIARHLKLVHNIDTTPEDIKLQAPAPPPPPPKPTSKPNGTSRAGGGKSSFCENPQCSCIVRNGLCIGCNQTPDQCVFKKCACAKAFGVQEQPPSDSGGATQTNYQAYRPSESIDDMMRSWSFAPVR